MTRIRTDKLDGWLVDGSIYLSHVSLMQVLRELNIDLRQIGSPSAMIKAEIVEAIMAALMNFKTPVPKPKPKRWWQFWK